MILESDDGVIESLSNPEMQKLFRNAIADYRDVCMINTKTKFVFVKSENYWKIESISPLKDFSTVITGQADELVLALNGENISDDDSDEYDEDERDMYLIW